MGGGRKTQTFTAPPNQDLAAYSTSMRNLRKNDLGGVILGCKDTTIKECLSKQLFGLPAAHFQYIKNISPGLPLFLFNYTDRKLHGIYEAASHGQMNINPYGWTTDGSERTQFPAQVQIRGRLQCRPLLESQFKEIIANNYYNEFHFWFELDHTQTRKLISKLQSGAVAPVPQRSRAASVVVSPITSVPQVVKLASVEVASSSSTSVPQNTLNWRSCFPHTSEADHLKMEKSSERPCSCGKRPRSLCEHQSIIAKLNQDVEELKASKTEQSKKVCYLEGKLEQAELEIQQLKIWHE